ncbi:hypothetical protein GCM10023238_35240 [Streptomyces heliomycini]
MARDSGYSRQVFEQVWLRFGPSPGPHAPPAALHYWCEKVARLAQQASLFAAAAAARAPQGSLLAAMPLFAVFEHLPR